MKTTSHYMAVTTSPRSIKMYSMHEALAREHMNELRRQASEHRAASQARAERRERRLRWLARSTHARSS